jgi:transposase
VLQKPRGVIAPRVAKVGVDKFGIVCVDPAKKRSWWMMADFLGQVVIDAVAVEHDRPHLEAMLARVRLVVQQRGFQDVLVVIERTGNYHQATRRAFAKAGYDTRLVHPFAVKQFRLPADPGDKTDANDLAAVHRAATQGFGLIEHELTEPYVALRMLARHRRDLVEKVTLLSNQIREHLDQAMPGYAACFSDFWDSPVAICLARATGTPAKLLVQERLGLTQILKREERQFQSPTLDKLLAWARQAAAPSDDAALRQRVWMELDDARQQLCRNISRLEVDLAELLVKTPYLWLLILPGINVVSATDLAGEMGPIEHYANANAITGRAGLFPARSQSDEVDVTGTLVRTTNRRLRAALMLVADNLTKTNHFFIGQSLKWQQNNVDPRAIRVRVAKHFSRLLFALVAGRQLLRHHCAADRESLLRKLVKFHHAHHTTSEQLMPQLEAAAAQLTQSALEQEGQLLNAALTGPAHRRGLRSLADLLPLILAKYGIKIRPRSAASASVAATPVTAANVADSSSPVSVSGASLEVTQHSSRTVEPTASNGSNPV